MSSMKIIRYGAWAAVAVLGFAVVTVTIGHFRAIDKDALIAPIASIGGPFEMIDGSTGKTVTDADFKGKPSAYFFGFTFCPDVCPTTLSDVQGWIEKLGKDADKMNFAFVTVDPERDTPEVLKDYVAAFDSRIRPLSGSPENVQEMLKVYRVYSKKVTKTDGTYTMDHSAYIYLMDSENRFVGTIAYGEAEENAMAKLRRLIDNAGA